MFDTECLHTPYLPPPTQSSSSGNHRSSPALKAQHQNHQQVPEGDLLNLDGINSNHHGTNSNKPPVARRKTGFSKTPGGRNRNMPSSSSGNGNNGGDDTDDEEYDEEWVPDVFLFEYGTVVIWGMTEKEEKRFLSSL